MSIKPLSIPPKTLYQSILSTSSSFTLNDIKSWDGVTNLTASDFGSQAFGAFINATRTQIEFFEFDPATIANSSITILNRGLGFSGSQTPVTAYQLDWTANETTVLLGSDVPQFMLLLARLQDDNAFTGNNSFAILPTSTGGNASSGTQLITYAQALAMFTSGTGIINNITVAGTAGETLTKDQVIYLKVSDGRWWKADADTASTDENVILGIAQGAGSAGGVITGGVLLFGLATLSAISLTANTKYYVSNTAGAFSSTPGTTEVSLGISQTTTTFVFCPRYDQQLTEDQQDALAGTAGNPSASNPFVTSNDVAVAATASLIPRRRSTGDITVPAAPTNTTDAVSKAYADFSRTIPLGESFTGATTPQPAVIIDDLELRYTNETAVVGASTYSSNVTTRQIALKIIPRSNVTIGSARILTGGKNGTPANVTIEIQSNSSTIPSGTPVTNGTSNAVVAATIGTGHLTFTFATPCALTAGTTYWVVIKLASISDANNIIVQTLTNANAYAAFAGAQMDGSNVWQASSEMPYVKLIPSSGSGSLSLWRADGNGVEPLPIFDGFCITTGNAGDSGTIQKNITSGFSGLIPYVDYYVSNTIGTITANANEGMYIGTAISATQIFSPLKSTLPRFTRVALVNSINLIHPTLEDGTCLLVDSVSSVGVTVPAYGMQTYADATNPAGSGTILSSFLNNTGAGTVRSTVSWPLNKASYYQSNNTTGTLYWIGNR